MFMKKLLPVFLLIVSLSGLAVDLEAHEAVTHSVVGAGLAHVLGGSPALSLLVGVLTHIPLDIVPHYELSSVWEGVIDGLLTVGIVYVLWKKTDDPRVLWGAAGGLLPDVEHALSGLGIIRDDQKIFPTHSGLLRHGRSLPPLPGISLALGINALTLTICF